MTSIYFMANNSKEIRRRIKSIRNIGQITKAMELVSAAKMRKAQSAATSSRPYATLSAELLRNLASKTSQSEHPLLNRVAPRGQTPHAQKVLIILITSDRGLAGALNANVITKALQIFKDEGAGKVDFVTIGKKGTDAVKRLGGNIIATFSGKDKNIFMMDAKPAAQIAMQDFVSEKYEKVFVIYSDFVSTLVQRPSILQLLPFQEGGGGREKGEEFLFEPSAHEVLENLVVRAVEFAIYQAMVEAVASEHSSRMVAMRNANEAAGDLIDDLSLSYNQAIQGGITRELSEISAAKLAMEG